MPVPRDEPLQLRSVADNDQPESDIARELATRSLLSLATAFSESITGTGTEQAEADETPSAPVAVLNKPVGSAIRERAEYDSECIAHLDDDGGDSNESPFSYLPTTFSEIMSSRVGEVPGSSKRMGLAMEWAAGMALRTEVLEPVMSQFSGLPGALLPETIRFLGLYSRGELVLRGYADGIVHQGSIERVRQEDAPLVARWWEGDKFLSHTDQAWSDWWIRRCHIFDPGCEMVKLVNNGGETLGVVFYERNIVDRNSFGDDGLGRITLIRGIRVAPSLNPEVLRRRGDVTLDNVDSRAIYKTVTSLLFYHVLFMSVRYGCNAVGVNCPKDGASEHFYQALMGPPVAFDGTSGRRYHRISNQSRWKILRKAFHRQVELWLQLLCAASGEKVFSL